VTKRTYEPVGNQPQQEHHRAAYQSRSIEECITNVSTPREGKKETHMPQRPEVKVGVIMRYEHQVFLIRHKNPHGTETWAAPGGALPYGESPQEYATRKVLEETGITMIADPTFLTITNDIFEKEGRHDVTIWIEGTYVSGELWLDSDSGISAFGWTIWSALPRPLSLPFKNFLAQGFPWKKEEWAAKIGREHLEILRADLPSLLA
jgi:8-oxo-dGTP diphosphatase